MRNKDIPEYALSVLREHGIDTVPFDVLELARGEGIKVYKNSDVRLLCPTEYGRIFCHNDKSIIVYDDTRTHSQKRFTVAHELGHYFLKHREEHERFERYLELQRIRHGRHVERQADIFAQAILNPKITEE
ncbi:MAG: ImmA/IrrE family metallo-endopeptidase [Clostridia bacterium]|nr:ImmA/IrrE family metallo-endopeptidase [Clostridia bacterium]